MLHYFRHVIWRALIRKSILVLDEIAKAADDLDETMNTMRNYIECSCVLGFAGEHCDKCTVGDAFLREIRKPERHSAAAIL